MQRHSGTFQRGGGEEEVEEEEEKEEEEEEEEVEEVVVGVFVQYNSQFAAPQKRDCLL